MPGAPCRSNWQTSASPQPKPSKWGWLSKSWPPASWMKPSRQLVERLVPDHAPSGMVAAKRLVWDETRLAAVDARLAAELASFKRQIAAPETAAGVGRFLEQLARTGWMFDAVPDMAAKRAELTPNRVAFIGSPLDLCQCRRSGEPGRLRACRVGPAPRRSPGGVDAQPGRVLHYALRLPAQQRHHGAAQLAPAGAGTDRGAGQRRRHGGAVRRAERRTGAGTGRQPGAQDDFTGTRARRRCQRCRIAEPAGRGDARQSRRHTCAGPTRSMWRRRST